MNLKFAHKNLEFSAANCKFMCENSLFLHMSGGGLCEKVPFTHKNSAACVVHGMFVQG